MMTPRPNILIILADQHRFDCLGSAGNGEVRTPHLDGLAADGVRFENCFCPYPVCTPSRYSMLSGVPVHEHRGWSNLSTPAPGTVLFPQLLRQAGYRTDAVGKMHFTPTYLDAGFERMVLAEQNGPGRWDDDYHRDLRQAGLIDRVDLEDQEEPWRSDAPADYWRTFGARVSDLPEESHSTSWIGERAMEVLRTWSGPSVPSGAEASGRGPGGVTGDDTTQSASGGGGGGHLLMVGFIKPHHPFDPPARWAEMYDPEAISILPGWTGRVPPDDQAANRGYFPNDALGEPALRRVTAYYYATISHMDYHVGRMIELLKQRGLYDDTLIVFAADHGELLGFHHLLLKGGWMYDPLVRVPLIVKFPRQRSAGQRRAGLASLLDIAPTVLAQAGVPGPPTMKGLDLSSDEPGRAIVFAEVRRRAVGTQGEHDLHVMARTPTRKLILAHPRQRSRLFDLECDPREMTSLLADPARADEIAALEQAARAWAGDAGDSPIHLDEAAPRIDQPNVPALNDNHRREMFDWFNARMRRGQ